MPKLIRELRMGPPKSFKTGAVVGSYPKPLLYFGFDRSGIDVIPQKGVIVPKDKVQFDCTYDEILFATPDTLDALCKEPRGKQAKITAIDFTQYHMREIDELLKASTSSAMMQQYVKAYNIIVRNQATIPWATFVFDSTSGFQDMTVSHIASVNPNALADARQWAHQAGQVLRKTIISATALQCHIVFICHTFIDKNETTSLVLELPDLVSSLRNDVSGLFSQVFYATQNMGKPVVWTADKMFVKGAGARWPQGLPTDCGPDFQSIYGKEVGLQ